MVEIKTIHIQENSFIGILLKLPKNMIYMITSTRCILAGEQFDINYFNRVKKQSRIVLVEDCDDFEDLLTSRVVKISDAAKALGVQEGMSGEAALVILNENQQ